MSYPLLDTNRYEPKISGRRISVLDVYDTVSSSEQWETVLYDDWGLTTEEVEQALDYYEEHAEELEALRREKRDFRERTA